MFVVMIVTATTFFTVFVVVIVTAGTAFAVIVVMFVTAGTAFAVIVVMFVTVRLFVLAQNRIRFIFVDTFLDFFQESRELIRVAVEHQFFLHKVDRNIFKAVNFSNVSFKVACTVSTVNACDTHFVASAGNFFMFMVMIMTARTAFTVFMVVIVAATAFFAMFVMMFVTATAFLTVFVVVYFRSFGFLF